VVLVKKRAGTGLARSRLVTANAQGSPPIPGNTGSGIKGSGEDTGAGENRQLDFHFFSASTMNTL
jgi:hypothetical protein